MFKFFKEFDKKYSTLFFCLSLLVIIVFLAYASVLNKEKNDICTTPNTLVNNYINYLYDVTYSSGEKVINLSIKRYDKKYLIEKNENGLKSSYYIYYTDILEKASNDEYIKFRGGNIIEGLDNKFLILEYINDISLESSVKNENELTCYINRKLELSMCINLDDTITLKGNNFEIIYNIKETGTVKDFNVKTNINYIDENINNDLTNDSIVQ